MADPIIVGKGPRTRGPLKNLELNKYASDQTLMYPLDIADMSKYKHYIKFNVNIPERSTYSKIVQTGSAGTADINRALAAAAGFDQLGAGSDPLSVLGAAGAAGLLTGLFSAGSSILGAASKNKLTNNAVKGAALKGALTGLGATAVIASIDMTRKTKRLKQTILMYVPDTVQDTRVQVYDAVSVTDAMGKAGFAAQGASAAGMSMTEGAKDLVGLGGAQTAGGGAVAEAMGLAAEASGGFGGGIKDVLMASFGYAQNPQIEILFKNVQNREFQFDFKFTPKSQKEANMVLDIIKAFKFHSAPEIAPNAAGRYFIPPSEFDIEFMYNGERNKALHRISTCVLEGIDVNYVTAGQFATYDDGVPVEIAMQLRFKEVEIMHKKLVEEGY